MAIERNPDMESNLAVALEQILSTVAELDIMLAQDQWRRKCVPIAGDRLAAPFELTWQDDVLIGVTFEAYDAETPLGDVSERVYRSLLARPEASSIRRLTVGNVACKEFSNSQLLGDAIGLLARAGLPPNLEWLQLERIGPISNAGDLGYYSSEPLAPLLPKLQKIRRLDIAGCEALGNMNVPALRELHIHSSVSEENLKKLARADLPALEHLELCSEPFDDIEARFRATRALLRSSRLPRLSYLVLENLDLDEDQRLELEDDEEADAEPPSWVDMIADSPVLRQLRGLELVFRDDERELPRLVERAEAFAHLATLEFWGAHGAVRLEFPTRESIRQALEG